MAFEEREKWWEKNCSNNIGTQYWTPKQFYDKGWEEALRKIYEMWLNQTPLKMSQLIAWIKQELGE